MEGINYTESPFDGERTGEIHEGYLGMSPGLGNLLLKDWAENSRASVEQLEEERSPPQQAVKMINDDDRIRTWVQTSFTFIFQKSRQ